MFVGAALFVSEMPHNKCKQLSNAGEGRLDAISTPRKPGVTSPRVATDASKVLQNPKATPAEKSAAGAALRDAGTKPAPTKK